MPIQIQSKTDGSDSKLPSFQNNKEVTIILKTLGDLFHHIGLAAEKVVHLLEAMLFSFNLELLAEVIEVIEVKLHLPQLSSQMRSNIFMFSDIRL